MLVLPPPSMKLFEEIHIKVVDQKRKNKDTKLCDGTLGFCRECSKVIFYVLLLFCRSK